MANRQHMDADAQARRIMGALAWHLAQHGKALVTINGVEVLDIVVPDGSMSAEDRASVLASFTPDGDAVQGGNA